MSFPEFIGMIGLVAMLAQNYKVAETVIALVMIDMVNDLIFSERSAQMLRHLVTMGRNVSQAVCVWMRRIASVFVARCRIKGFSALPRWIFRHRPITECGPTFTGTKPRFFATLNHARFFASFAWFNMISIFSFDPFSGNVWTMPSITFYISPGISYGGQ